MSELLNGIEVFGLDKLNDLNLFEDKKKIDTVKIEEKKLDLEDYLFDKTYVCPVCNTEFKNKTIKHGKNRLVSTHTDLRPYFEPIDSILYDVIICNECGYAAQTIFFGKLLDKQIDLIKENITPKFKKKVYPAIFTTEIAIERFKLALYNTIIIKGKDSEKAYSCLKMAWLYRSLKESEIEKQFLNNALEGFNRAYSNENLPICGIEENTYMYLLGELCRRVGKTEEALRWMSKVMLSRNASERIKNRAYDIKELIKKEKK